GSRPRARATPAESCSCADAGGTPCGASAWNHVASRTQVRWPAADTNIEFPATEGEDSMARILVIDDETQIRVLLQRVLESEGHEVFDTRDGREALTIAESQPLDLVITDIMMPDTDGIEVITTLRRSLPGIKILAISGGGLMRDRALAVAHLLGAHD